MEDQKPKLISRLENLELEPGRSIKAYFEELGLNYLPIFFKFKDFNWKITSMLKVVDDRLFATLEIEIFLDEKNQDYGRMTIVGCSTNGTKYKKVSSHDFHISAGLIEDDRFQKFVVNKLREIIEKVLTITEKKLDQPCASVINLE